ncbi:hypothetical protein HK102_008025 [Quaeritorhiza haematococci]|nr:hypothetical protein HK102_008025 [Quaeritorhiza haematococci]
MSVLITGWSRRQPSNCEKPFGSRRHSVTFVLDPATLDNPQGERNTFLIEPINEEPLDKERDVLYCSGHATLPDGRVFFTGGSRYNELGKTSEEEFGVEYARMYDPITNSITRINQTAPIGSMWYPTNTILPNGKVLVGGGFFQCCDGHPNTGLALFDPLVDLQTSNPWTLIARHEESAQEIAPGIKDYIHSIVLPKPVQNNGREYQVAMMGHPGKMVMLNVNDGVPLQDRFYRPPNGQRPNNAPAWDGTSLLTITGEIMVAGGSQDPIITQRIDLYNPATDSWRSVDAGISRMNPASVLLPDGTILLMSGEDNDKAVGNPRRPQIFDPRSGTVTTFDPWPSSEFRGYHNNALLLKDGRILLGGGTWSQGGIACEQTNMEIMTPPYLRTGKPRPTIATEGKTVSPMLFAKDGSKVLDVKLESGVPADQIGQANLLAFGSFTHAFDQNQKIVPLSVTMSGGDSLSLKLPTDQVIIPGNYMLYLVSKDGVPSVAEHVKIE